MLSENDHSAINDHEINLLELVLALAENLRLLTFAPLIAGLFGIGFSQFISPEFESKAVQLGNPTLLAIYNSDQLRDAVIKSVSFAKPGEDADRARKRLSNDLQVSLNAKDKILTVTGQAGSAESAQKLVQATVENAAVFNKPQLAQIDLLKQQIELGIAREQETSKAASKVSQQILVASANNQAALAQSQAQLLEGARAAQATTANLADQLSRLQTFEIIQNPTFPTRKIWPSEAKFATAFAAVAFFLTLLFVFVRFGIQTAYRSSSETKNTLDRIHKAWKHAVGLNKNI